VSLVPTALLGGPGRALADSWATALIVVRIPTLFASLGLLVIARTDVPRLGWVMMLTGACNAAAVAAVPLVESSSAGVASPLLAVLIVLAESAGSWFFTLLGTLTLLWFPDGRAPWQGLAGGSGDGHRKYGRPATASGPRWLRGRSPPRQLPCGAHPGRPRRSIDRGLLVPGVDRDHRLDDVARLSTPPCWAPAAGSTPMADSGRPALPVRGRGGRRHRQPLSETWGGIAFTLGTAAIPAAIAVAVLRYRLYDIDRIVSRTVAYTLVVGLLLAVYTAAAALLTRILPAESDLAVAAATLTAAALFTPLRRGIERRVDPPLQPPPLHRRTRSRILHG
jgi:hypothetical protein